jgi:hypothetical protein
MTREIMASWVVALAVACGDTGATTTPSGASTGGGGAGTTTSNGSGGGSGTGGAPVDAGSAGGGGGSMVTDGSTGPAICDQIEGWAQAYKAAHPGNGGKDWDINAKTPAQIAADPAAQQLLSICGQDQRPVIPLLAWEYGGADHPWINPQASAVAYCVYIPVKPSSSHWQYDSASDHVTADVYVTCPEQNPCKNQQGANQILACLGDPTNIEILVDTASLNDGVDVGLALSNASTDLNLILPDGTKVHLHTDP